MKIYKYLLLFIIILFLRNIFGFDYNQVREITINDQFYDFNIFIDLGYYKISDSNNHVIDQNNFYDAIDNNEFTFFISSIDHRQKDYNLVIDENIDLKERDLYFDLNNLTINGSLGSIFDLNLEITNFYKKEDLFFLVCDTNLFVYLFESGESQFLFRIDTNQPIYNLEYRSYLDKNYLFLANGSNGIGIYEVDFNSSDFALNLGQIRFSYGELDYNTSYIYFLESAHTGGYLFSFVNHPGIPTRGVFYSILDLLDLNSTVPDNRHNTISDNLVPQTIWHNQDLNRLIIPLKNSTNTGKIVFNDQPSGISIFSSGQFSGTYKNLTSLSEKAFSLNTDQLNVYNKDSIGDATTPLKTLDLNYPVRSFTINKDLNRFYVLYDNNIDVFDYNYENNNFLFLRNISHTDTNLNKIIYDNNYLYISKNTNFKKINLDNNYSLRFFIPSPKIKDLTLSPSNINYSLYSSFPGDLNFSFIIEDYNLLKNDSNFSPLTFDLNITNEDRSIPILKDQNIDNNICKNIDLTSKFCSFLINIKNINNSYSLTNGSYDFSFFTTQLNTVPFVFNLSRPSGGSGGSSKSSSSSSSSPPTPKPPQTPNYVEILDLLKQNYITKKDLFASYLLDFPILSFDLNVDSNTFSSDYNSLLEEYNNLPNIEITKTTISKDLPFFESKEHDIVNSYSKKITFLTSNNKKYVFVEIDLNFNENIILDNLDSSKIIKSTEDLNKFDSNFVIINKDLNYLLLDSAQNNYFDLIEIIKKSKVKEIIDNEIVLEEEIKEVKNYKITYGVIIFILFLLLFWFRNFFFN